MFQEIDQELLAWMREWDNLSNEYRQIGRDATTKRDKYDLMKAEAMLKAPDGTVAMKEAFVTKTCHVVALECHIAETTRDWCKKRLEALAGLTNAAQSRANLVKDEIRLTNSPRY